MGALTEYEYSNWEVSGVNTVLMDSPDTCVGRFDGSHIRFTSVKFRSTQKIKKKTSNGRDDDMFPH